jgi:hypothetical protein
MSCWGLSFLTLISLDPNFKPLQFEGFKNETGSNRFLMSPQKWVKATQAIGIFSKSGRYGDLEDLEDLGSGAVGQDKWEKKSY